MAPEIVFPNLGITINHLSRVCFTIFNMPVYWYGVIMTASILIGGYAAGREAERTGLKKETAYDCLFFAVIAAIIVSRAYYVIFSWDSYRDNLMKIFALREGGLAVYGSLIGGIAALIIFCRVKKINAPALMDCMAIGFILGQAIGRWGNFINREAFGGYTENIFAMRYLRETVSVIPAELHDMIITVNGAEYIQVHPTFLYESLWNTAVFAILLAYRKKKKFEGEVVALYFLLYASGRVWIEGLRTDQLLIPGTGVAVSQVLSAVLIAASLCFLVYKRKGERGKE